MRNEIKVNYKIDKNLKVTNYSGLGIFHSVMRRFSLFKKLSSGLGMKSRVRTFSEFDYIYLLMINLASGGGVISDINRFRNDKVFQKIFNFSKAIPQSSAVYKFLDTANEGSVRKFQEINTETLSTILKKVYKNRKKPLRLLCFLDSTELEVYGKRFEGSSKNYNGDTALRVHALFLEDFLVSLRLYSPANKFVTFGWESLFEDLKSIQKVINSQIYILMDSAYFNYDIISQIEKEGWQYSITLKKFDTFFEESRIIPEEKWKADYSSFEYIPNNTDKSYRVIVKRTERERDLFGKYDYYYIITNNRELSAEQIYLRHSVKMGMENRFKDLLIHLNLHHPRKQSLLANRLYYQIAMLVYNLIKSIQYLHIKGDDFFLSIRSFILKYIFIPGKLITHAGKLILKLPYYPHGEKLLLRLTT